ncbi:MAG: Ig-like domain-containing protein, partial [Erysipelotrichaceae bacterium]|nr:Ig-like domain-containing protein [Erysipelotrichaceae bacterium]
MSKKRTRLKLKDNVRKTLISLLSVALLVTTIHFTNVRAEGTDEPAPTPAADVMLENAEPANNGGGEEGSNEQETEAVIPEQPAPEENIQPQVSPDTDEPKPEETFVPEEKREVVDGDPNGPNEEAEEKKEEEVTPEPTEEPKPENEEENKVQEYELTFVVNADDEAVYTVYLNGSEEALVFDEEKKSVETVEEGEAEFKLAAEGYDAKVTMGEDKVEINPEENTEDTYKVDVKENTTITIELTKIEEEEEVKEYTVEGAIELFEKWFEDQENEELYEAFVAYFENLSEEDFATVDAYIAKRMAEAEDDDIMLLAADKTVELWGTVTLDGQGSWDHEWSSDNTKVATVSGTNSTGTVTGASIGTATITHTYKNHLSSMFGDTSTHTETFTVEVVEPTPAYTVKVGETVKITGYNDNNATWSSGDTSIATVTDKGNETTVTGVKEGYVLITNTKDKDNIKTYVVKVERGDLFTASVKADPDAGLVEDEVVTYDIVI